MAVLVFNALRDLLPGRDMAEQVTLQVKLRDASRGRDVKNHQHRSSAGGLETINSDETDTRWQIEIGPIRAAEKDAVNEFAESTAGGEPFLLSLFDTIETINSDSAMLQLRRIDEQHRFAKLVRTPDLDREVYSLRVTAVE